MSRGVGLAQIDSTGILYGEFRPGSMVELARRSAAQKINLGLAQLSQRRITSFAETVAFIADFYRLCLRREVIVDPTRSRKFKINRAIAVFECYRPNGAVEWLEDIVRQIDRLERKVARKDLSDAALLDAVSEIALDCGFRPSSRASAAITAYLVEVNRQREVEG